MELPYLGKKTVDQATDEEIIEAYLADGYSEEDARIYLPFLRGLISTEF